MQLAYDLYHHMYIWHIKINLAKHPFSILKALGKFNYIICVFIQFLEPVVQNVEVTGNVDNHQDETDSETEILMNAPLLFSCILTESGNL